MFWMLLCVVFLPCMCVWEWIWAVSATAGGLRVVSSAILAQASSSRLGESIRMLTLVLPRALAQARGCVLSDRPAHSGETASPEREIVNLPMTHCCKLA